MTQQRPIRLEDPPYAVIKKEFGVEHTIRFASENLSFEEGEPQPDMLQELILQTQSSVSGSILGVGKLGIKLNITSLLGEGPSYINKSHIEFHSVYPNKSVVKVQLPIQIVKTSSDKILDPQNSRKDVIVLIWVLVLLVAIAIIRMVSWIKYHLTVREAYEGF